MRIVESLPCSVREIENLWIPMADGARLAARIWKPSDADAAPVPAILEYIPYRKRDLRRARDEPMHRYFAGHGYAAVRVDLRGSGDSDGLLVDEYTTQEHDDALEVIRWIAEQPWCSGSVGMMGISWGGFNSLQVAAHRPPELRAIITLCSTDDRYADDAHYMGGCLLNENLIWGTVLFGLNALPPDPEIAGERWREMWLERLEHDVPFPALWLRHQRRDGYWKHGSVCEDFGRIACPVYAIGGWADGYSNAVPRLLQGLKVPRKGLVGPWTHVFPHEGVPGPAIGFLQEAIRWWDHWLKGIDTGIMNEPMYRVWMQESVPPQASYDERPGRWVAETEWPSPRIGARRLFTSPGRLREQERGETELDISSPPHTGLTAGNWCGFGGEGEMPIDQRETDGKSLCFDSVPLTERLEILGAPEVTLELKADRPVAQIAVRLNDVAPDGTSARVTYGLLNLTHRSSHEHPEPLEPGHRYRVAVKLNDIAHAFPASHVIRLALSTGYWPIAWPSPEPVTLTVLTGASWLALPVRPPDPDDARLRPFPAPECAPGLSHRVLRPAEMHRSTMRDLTTGETLYTIVSDGGEFDGAALAHVESIGLDVGSTIHRCFRIGDTDPLSACATVEQHSSLRRGTWSVSVDTRTELTCTRRELRIRAELSAEENGVRVLTRQWDEAVPRDLV